MLTLCAQAWHCGLDELVATATFRDIEVEAGRPLRCQVGTLDGQSLILDVGMVLRRPGGRAETGASAEGA